MKRATRLILPVLLIFAGLVFGADTYVIDRNHTNVGFIAKHLVISKVHGRFTDFSGTIQWDDQDLSKSSLQGTIKVASINTGAENRDEDLRSDSFFDAAKYPEITFASSKIEKQEDGYLIHGTLTMHGVSKEVSFPAKLNGPIEQRGNKRIGFEGHLTINRQDYGVSWNKKLDNGGLAVSDEIEIQIDGEAATQSEKPKQ